jgi:hypothetical protein
MRKSSIAWSNQKMEILFLIADGELIDICIEIIIQLFSSPLPDFDHIYLAMFPYFIVISNPKGN